MRKRDRENATAQKKSDRRSTRQHMSVIEKGATNRKHESATDKARQHRSVIEKKVRIKTIDFFKNFEM